MLKHLLLVIFLSIVGQTAAVDAKTEKAENLRSIQGDQKVPQKKGIYAYLSSEKLTPKLLKSDVVVNPLNLSQISGSKGKNHILEQYSNNSGVGDYFCEGNDCTGYILEFTRTNKDCSGRVEGIGGLLLGHPTLCRTPEGVLTTMVTGDVSETSYEYRLTISSDLDLQGESGGEGFGGPRCSADPDGVLGGMGPGFIPYSTELFDHGGYFYGHKLVTSGFPAVLRVIGGAFYDLYFDTLDHCLTGERPMAFFAHLKKGECYFNPTNYGIEGIDEHTGQAYKVHSWFKVVGFDSKEGTMIFTIHNNNDCDHYAFMASKKRKVEFLRISPRKLGFSEDSADGEEPVYGECQPFMRGSLIEDGPPMRRRLQPGPDNMGILGRMWVKRTAA